MEIASQYDEYLREFYKKHEDFEDLSYNELYDLLIEDCYAESDFIHRYLRLSGNETRLVYYNNRNLQRKSKHYHDGMTWFELLIKQIKDYNPDIIMISNLTVFTESQVEEIRGCLPYTGKLIGNYFSLLTDSFKRNARLLDLIGTGSRDYVETIKQGGANAYLLRHAFEPSILGRLGTPVERKGICFIGSIVLGGGHDNRVKMLDLLNNSDFLFSSYGMVYEPENMEATYSAEYCEAVIRIKRMMKPSIFGVDYYSELAKYNIETNIHPSEIKGGIGNMRMFEATGVGCCLVTDYREGIEELFTDGEEIVVYHSMDELVDKLKWLTNDYDAVRRIALSGQRRTLNEYTYKEKADILDGEIQRLIG